MVGTFLKKLGSVLATGLAIASGVSPALLGIVGPKTASAIGRVTDGLSAIIDIVVQAEVWLQGSGTGPEKFARALPMVVAALKGSEILSGHKIADESLFETGAGKILNGCVDILNSLKESIQTSGDPVKPPITPPTAG